MHNSCFIQLSDMIDERLTACLPRDDRLRPQQNSPALKKYGDTRPDLRWKLPNLITCFLMAKSMKSFWNGFSASDDPDGAAGPDANAWVDKNALRQSLISSRNAIAACSCGVQLRAQVSRCREGRQGSRDGPSREATTGRGL